jgi:hypothetical protein
MDTQIAATLRADALLHAAEILGVADPPCQARESERGRTRAVPRSVEIEALAEQSLPACPALQTDRGLGAPRRRLGRPGPPRGPGPQEEGPEEVVVPSLRAGRVSPLAPAWRLEAALGLSVVRPHL